jgi:hypothetical protein
MMFGDIMRIDQSSCKSLYHSSPGGHSFFIITNFYSRSLVFRSFPLAGVVEHR